MTKRHEKHAPSRSAYRCKLGQKAVQSCRQVARKEHKRQGALQEAHLLDRHEPHVFIITVLSRRQR